MESMIALESSELLRRGPIKNPNILGESGDILIDQYYLMA